MVWILKTIYFVFPVLSIGSVVWFFVSDVGVWVFALFFLFGFLGMFAGAGAQQLERRKRDTFTFRAGDPTSLARAAFFEIEGKGEIPGLSQIRDDVLALVDDREKIAASIVEDKLDPRALIYLLVTNVASDKLCSGQYHIYRGILSFTGKQLLEAFTVASKQMVDLGVHDEKTHAAEVANLRKELGSIG